MYRACVYMIHMQRQGFAKLKLFSEFRVCRYKKLSDLHVQHETSNAICPKQTVFTLSYEFVFYMPF